MEATNRIDTFARATSALVLACAAACSQPGSGDGATLYETGTWLEIRSEQQRLI